MFAPTERAVQAVAGSGLQALAAAVPSAGCLQLCREEALPVQIASAAALGKKMKASGYENLKARDGMKYGLRKKKLVDDSPAPDMKAILAAWDDDKASGGGAAGQCVTV